MKYTDFATYIRYRTKTNATTFTDAQIIAIANVVKDDIAEAITKADEDFFLREFTRNLEAGKRRYSFPSDIMSHMKALSLKLDGTNWTSDITTVDLAGMKTPIKTEADIIANFATVQPSIEVYSNGFQILSGAAIIDVTDGISLWATQYPADITSLASTDDMSVNPSTTSFGIPRAFHKILANGVIIEYKSSKEKPIPLTKDEQLWDQKLHDKIDTISPQNMSKEQIASYPRDTGEDY